MIIVEGMDNAGKTTLIETLKKIHGDAVDVIKPPGPFSSSKELKDWMGPEIDKCRTFQYNRGMVIYDRFPIISELVYGPIVREKSMVTGPVFDETFHELTSAAFPVTIIYCRPPNSRILDFGFREQMDGVRQKSLELLMGYDELMSEISKIILQTPDVKSSMVLYDWTNPISHNIVLSQVESELKRFKFYGYNMR